MRTGEDHDMLPIGRTPGFPKRSHPLRKNENDFENEWKS